MCMPKAAGHRFAVPSRCKVDSIILNRSTISFSRAGLCSQPFTMFDAAGNLPEAFGALLTPSLHLPHQIVLNVIEQDRTRCRAGPQPQSPGLLLFHPFDPAGRSRWCRVLSLPLQRKALSAEQVEGRECAITGTCPNCSSVRELSSWGGREDDWLGSWRWRRAFRLSKV